MMLLTPGSWFLIGSGAGAFLGTLLTYLKMTWDKPEPHPLADPPPKVDVMAEAWKEALKHMGPIWEKQAEGQRLRDDLNTRRWEDLGQALEDTKRWHKLIAEHLFGQQGEHTLRWEITALTETIARLDQSQISIYDKLDHANTGLAIGIAKTLDGLALLSAKLQPPPAGKRKKK